MSDWLSELSEAELEEELKKRLRNTWDSRNFVDGVLIFIKSLDGLEWVIRYIDQGIADGLPLDDQDIMLLAMDIDELAKKEKYS